MITEKLENREQLEDLKKNGKFIIEWGEGSNMGVTLCTFVDLCALFISPEGYGKIIVYS